MKYRDAKRLLPDDVVIRKLDKLPFKVVNIEVYGQFLLVRINCIDLDMPGSKVSLYQEDVE